MPGLLLRLTQERLFLGIVTALTLVMIPVSSNIWAILALWTGVVIAALFKPREKPAKPAVPVAALSTSGLRSPIPNIFATVAALDMPVMILSGSSALLFQNKAAEKAFGTILVGSHISARLRAPAILDIVNTALATGAPAQSEYIERVPADRIYCARIAPVDMPQPAAERFFVLSFRDLSDQHRIDKMRSDFIANASHELRTPLASLRGFIETLMGPAKNDTPARERFLAIMLDQILRMTRLVDDLMSLSRAELHSQPVADTAINIGDVLTHVCESLVPLAKELDVELHLSLPEEPVTLSGSRDDFVQVFQNLIENACKYGQDGKQVDVELTPYQDHPQVSIRDHGPGIAPEHVPRLTERFYRVNVENSRSKKGTGLGLAIVKHILTRYQAQLVVTSEVGKGSNFVVKF